MIKRNYRLAAASLLSMFATYTFAMTEEVNMVPVQLDGDTVELEIIVHKPDGYQQGTKLPTVILNHGSTGWGTNPSYFTAKIDYFDALIAYFGDRGWAVAVPMRRGRGNSEGLYDEGFDSNRKYGYTCETGRSLAGAQRALDDVHASVEAIEAMPFVDTENLIIGGISRGGILSTAYAGEHPDKFKGIINFVGGWMGDGCPTAEGINGSLFVRGAATKVESIWLYGNNDHYYRMSHSQSNFNKFVAAGGKGDFHQVNVEPGQNGHFIGSYPQKWTALMDEYLDDRNL
ncbi:alpha/beta hydrolase family protein [Vibrio mexicanus]|uniref:alpha/beta hydrolase family protein n=1 Tax=Vibrio mexicanus TaxID=1004326 RepID=UPI00069B7640|nr:alpha/beta fold hydrolase [Vibrio mexicanus]